MGLSGTSLPITLVPDVTAARSSGWCINTSSPGVWANVCVFADSFLHRCLSQAFQQATTSPFWGRRVTDELDHEGRACRRGRPCGDQSVAGVRDGSCRKVHHHERHLSRDLQRSERPWTRGKGVQPRRSARTVVRRRRWCTDHRQPERPYRRQR